MASAGSNEKALGGDANDKEMLDKLKALQEKAERRKAKHGSKAMELDPNEVLAILPHLSKEEKKKMYQSLKAEQEKDALSQGSKTDEETI